MQRHQVENLVPLAFTLFSAYIILTKSAPSALFALGTAVTTIGLVIWWAGKLTLGDAFTAMPKAKRIVTNGIYSRVRHPIYVGLSLVLIGWTLILPKPALIAVAAIVIIGLVIRAHLEEKVLLRKFGKQYTEYRKRTWL